MPVPPMSIPSTWFTSSPLPSQDFRGVLARIGGCGRCSGARTALGIPDPGTSLFKERVPSGPVQPIAGTTQETPRGLTMPGFRELLARTKQNIDEVDPAEAEERLG